jgi:hypothetical protein
MKVESGFKWCFRGFQSFYRNSGDPFLAIDKVGDNFVGILMEKNLTSPGHGYSQLSSGHRRKHHPVMQMKPETAAKQLRMSGHPWLVLENPDPRQLRAVLDRMWTLTNLLIFDEALTGNRNAFPKGNPDRLLALDPESIVSPTVAVPRHFDPFEL